MIKIDRKNLKLLSMLDMHANIAVPSLAKKISVSRQVAEYRLQKLMREGVITGVRAVYDHRKLGQNIYRVLFQLYQSPTRDIDAFAQELIKKYNVMWVAKLGGGWDLVVNFVAPDIQTFDDEFMKLAGENEKIIQQYIILTYVNITDCHRGYLTGKKEETTFKHNMRGPQVALDATDKKLLRLLGKDCRESNISLGKKVGLTGNAVRYRIRQYLSQGVLLGYRMIPDPAKLRYQNSIVLLTINNLSKSGERALYEFLTHHNNVTFIVKHLGAFRIAFEIETKTTDELEETIRILRTQFHALITDARVYPVLKEYTATYDAGINQ